MFLRLLLSIYKSVFSVHIGGGCRFTPSCSEYASQCADSQPPLRAIRLIISRLGKCHPWGPFGLDPVPERTKINE